MAKLKLLLPNKEEVLAIWDNCFVINKEQLPKHSGVYILSVGKLFLYIGSSSNIKNRLSKLAKHPIRELARLELKPKNKSVSEYVAQELNLQVYWKVFKSGEVRERYQFEWQMIKHFEPVINKSQLLWTSGLRLAK